VRDLLHVPLPEFHEIDIADTQLAQVIAAGRAPDLVLVLKDRTGRAVRVLVIEIQRKRESRERALVPMYIPVLGAKWGLRRGAARWSLSKTGLHAGPEDHLRQGTQAMR